MISSNVIRALAGVLCALSIGGNSSVQAAACPVKMGKGELSLQTIMDGMLGAGALDVRSGCMPEGQDRYWTVGNGMAVTLLGEYAGFASQNAFGIYDAGDPSRRLELFSAADSTGTYTALSVLARNGGYDVTATTGRYVRHASFQSTSVGFYLSTPQTEGTFSSDTARNADRFDHLLAYPGGDGIAFFGCAVPSALRGQSFGRSDYLLAWEDLLHGGDRDYQDMLVMLSGVALPASLPGSLGMLGAGLAGMGLWRRRQRQ